MKVLTFFLGLAVGAATTYVVLTRFWWPDVRVPDALQSTRLAQATAPGPSDAPSPIPLPSPTEPEALPTPPVITPQASATPIDLAVPGAPTPEARTVEPPVLTSDVDRLRARGLLLPVSGIESKSLHDDFKDDRGGRTHDALDILAPRGTAVLAVDDGRIEKLFTSVRGGLTIYQFDPQSEYCYYYAHLDRYAPGLAAGKTVRKGEVIGYVGTTGNAPPNTPHLHFTIFRLGAEKRWWEGTAINAYPLWATPALP